MTQMSRQTQDGAEDRTLHVALELSKTSWKLSVQRRRGASASGGDGGRARDWRQFEAAVATAKQRFGLPRDATVRSCYEAGRDGFWIHRALGARGIDNVVVDAASIEVNRLRRRAKTDRLDAVKLVTQLLRHHRGERVWSVVRVPGVPDEVARHLHRDLDVLKTERRAHRTWVQAHLFTHGLDQKVGRCFLDTLPALRQ